MKADLWREEGKAFADTAGLVATAAEDLLFGCFWGIVGRRRGEVVMLILVGHSGSGKSWLVRVGDMELERRDWHFLRCKFDR